MDTKNYIDTSNWTELTMLPPDEAILREYDGLVGLAILSIYSLSKDLGKIRLFNFNRKDKEHLFVLRMALMARDLYQFPIEIDCHWWDRLCINWKIRKSFNKVGKTPDFSFKGVYVNELLTAMRPGAIERLGKTFKFSDIYDVFYEGSCD